MAVEYSDGRPDEVSRFSVSTSAEVTIQILERDGHQFIIIKEQQQDGSPSTEHTIEIPAALLPELRRAVTVLAENIVEDDQPKPDAHRAVAFAHESEEEFARILDFYHIAWEYEPRTFAIEWDERGNITSSFTPDFYLPAQGLYIELTTLKQPLVTRKNRKVRKLRKLYPEVNLKVLYASDFQRLVDKFVASRWRTERVASERPGDSQ
jgi:hypothetical protein